MSKIIERKIGEVITVLIYNFTKLKVVEQQSGIHHCSGCFFRYFGEKTNYHTCIDLSRKLGECFGERRSDGKDVIFVQTK